MAVAQHAGGDKNASRDIESGQRIPSVGTIVKLAAALGVSAPWLAYGIATQQRPQEQAATGWASDCKQCARRGTYRRSWHVGRAESSQPFPNRKRRSVWRRYHRANSQGPRSVPGWLSGVGPMVPHPAVGPDLHLLLQYPSFGFRFRFPFICIRGFPSRVLDDGKTSAVFPV